MIRPHSSFVSQALTCMAVFPHLMGSNRPDAPPPAGICDGEGMSPARVHMLAALFVCEGMGAAAFGIHCPEGEAERLLDELAAYARIPLFLVRGGEAAPWHYEPAPRDPDAIPCSPVPS